MSKKKDIRNPVAEAAAFLTKPSRHRDRKKDYARREKHPARSVEGEERRKAIEEQRLRESEVVDEEIDEWCFSRWADEEFLR